MISSTSCSGWIPASAEALRDEVREAAVLQLERRDVHAHPRRRARGQPLPHVRLPAGLLDHPAPHRDDEARLLRDGDELRRRHEAAIRVAPAQQRLRTDHPPGADGEDRLVVEDELVPFERSFKLASRLQAREQLSPHLGLEELHLAPAVQLGSVHRQVSVAQKLVGRPPPVRKDDPDAGRQPYLPFSADVERPADCLHHASGHDRRLGLRRNVLEEDRELVAADAGRSVRLAEAAAQALRHGHEQPVAELVATACRSPS